MGLNSYQVTFESCGDHYRIYGRDIQDVMGSVTGGAGVYGQGGRGNEASAHVRWIGRTDKATM
jgi:hypothetical protein